MIRTPLVVLFLLTATAAAGPIKFARYPHISDQGPLAFSYHGDIWLADGDGKNPRRVTAHLARDTFPRFSPDGEWLAFRSDRMGNDDVYVVPTTGGEPWPITFHSTDDDPLYWTPDGEGVLIASSRSKNPWGSPLYIAPLDGSLPRPLGMDRAAAGMISQDGRTVAFNRLSFRYWRKSYRGNNNTDVWTQPVGGGPVTQLTDLDVREYQEHTQDALPMWGADGWIYFLSEKNGTYNLWKISPDGGQPTQVTRHERDGVQYPSISPAGKTIVYECDFELWRYDLGEAEPRKIAVEMKFDPKDNSEMFFTSDDAADGFSPSPDGSQVAVDHHGEIFIVPTDPELGEKKRVTRSAWRDRGQDWSPDGEKIAYISDESGDEELWIHDVETGVRRQLTDQETDKSSFYWSPDSTRIVFTAANSLWISDVETGATEELAHNEDGGFRVSSFSNDGTWLVYSRADASLNYDTYLFDIDARQEHNVTRHVASDGGGYLTPDNKTLVFGSSRDGDRHLYALSLQKLTEDPNDPLVRARNKDKGKKGSKKGSDKKDDDTGEGETKDDDEEGASDEEKPEVAKDEPSPIEIDFDDIDRRPRRLTSGSSVSWYRLSNDGKKVRYTTSSGLHEIGVDGRGGKQITSGSFSGLTPTTDGKKYFYRSGSNVYSMTSSGGSKKKVEFDLRYSIDRRAEWRQIFHEAWRVMKYRFYDPDMHGVDWEAMRERYEPYLAYVGENQDLYDLCNEMIGELNASHTGVSGPPTRDMPRHYSTRHLGLYLTARDGHYVIDHILRDGPADKEWLDLRRGDRVLSIDGQPLKAGDNYHRVLNEVLNDYVNVGVASIDTSNDDDLIRYGEPRTVRIKTITSTRTLKYEEWVHQRREIVDQRSNGKIGYVHIRSMNRSSLARFEEEIDRYWDKNGMVVDIRYNGGGNTDQELIDILERRPYEYWNYRWGGRSGGRRPRQAIAGPKVMLINWRSASDSEVTPQAFRDLELGRIVGNPTVGAVIATGSYGLINGARIRTPGSLVVTYDPTKPNNYGLNLENYGVPPDVWVENTPQDELDGRDRELETAVDEALRMLAEGTWQFGEDD